MKPKVVHRNQASPTFKIAVAVFGALGFLQILAVGSVYAQRAGVEREVVKYLDAKVVVIKETVPVEQIVEIPSDPSVEGSSRNVNEILKRVIGQGNVPDYAISKTSSNQLTSVRNEPSIQIENFGNEYTIKHPRVEKLLGLAREAIFMGDMGVAAMLVEEAQELDPGEPAVLDTHAQIAEDMGAYAKAQSLYMTIFQMGIEAGVYYKIAANKVKNGVGRSFEQGTRMQLGGISVERMKSGSSGRVMIPIRAKEGEVINPKNVEIKAHFYDLVGGEEIQPATPDSIRTEVWQNTNANWVGRSVETVGINYSVAKRDEVDLHLQGERKYYGQVIELYYCGEIQDSVAHPRSLHKTHAEYSGFREIKQEPLFGKDFIRRIDRELPLLPQKPR